MSIRAVRHPEGGSVTAAAMHPSRVGTRDATAADNRALIELAESCPMDGDVSLCVNRAPDFFALNRLEGDRWRVGVVDGPAGHPIGCVAVASRRAYLFGRVRLSSYVGDLKVHPALRTGVAADELERYARDAGYAMGGADLPMLLTILGGNAAMERRAIGPRGLPRLSRFATVRAHSISLLWPRPMPRGTGLTISRARENDVDEMAALWPRVARGRQFAPFFDSSSLAEWITKAPALELSDYFLARRRDGRLAGFLAFWDQSAFKQTRVVSYSRRLAAFRAVFNAGAPLVGAVPLPRSGQPLRYLSALHVCVPPDEPSVLRSLLLRAYNELRGSGRSFLNIGLDVRDPLSAALSGLFAQPTDFHACVTTPSGRYTGPALDDRPLHFETALS